MLLSLRLVANNNLCDLPLPGTDKDLLGHVIVLNLSGLVEMRLLILLIVDGIWTAHVYVPSKCMRIRWFLFRFIKHSFTRECVSDSALLGVCLEVSLVHLVAAIVSCYLFDVLLLQYLF